MVSEEAYEPQFGARPLKRFVQRQIETPLARMMIKENMPEGTKVNVDLNDSQELTFDVQNLQLNSIKGIGKQSFQCLFLLLNLLRALYYSKHVIQYHLDVSIPFTSEIIRFNHST